MAVGLENAEVIGLLVLVSGGYAATNMDNLLLLVLLMGGSSQRRAPVLAGFMAAAMLVALVAAFGLVLGAWLEPALLGYLGIIPLGLGLRLLLDRSRIAAVARPAARGGLLFTSFSLMLANSGDSLAIFLPLFSESSRALAWLELGLYLCMVLAWALLAAAISGREQLARKIERHGSAAVPWVMILVGVYILLDTGTDSLVAG